MIPATQIQTANTSYKIQFYTNNEIINIVDVIIPLKISQTLINLKALFLKELTKKNASSQQIKTKKIERHRPRYLTI